MLIKGTLPYRHTILLVILIRLIYSISASLVWIPSNKASLYCMGLYIT